MWDQKSAQKHSVISDSDNNKKLFESSSGQDSGFLSGPQYSSDDIDLQLKSEEHHRRSPTAGQQQPSTEETDLKFKQHSKDSLFVDSGLCESSEQSDPMILDGNLDLNLNEWFCGLKLDWKNDLDTKKSTPPTCSKPSAPPLWKICFMQDDDGDT